ncbi:hypothetical protein FRC03_003569 [Tulasnella sp. 419]|nr:hypothetical protein FRC03_003569 [Tulasnella sp. 419]
MQSQGSTYSTSSSQRDSVGIDTSRSHLVPEAPILPPPIHSNVYPIHHPTPSPAPSSLLSPSTMSSPSHGATQLPHQTISPPPLSDHDFNRITSRINAMKNGAGPSSSATPAPDYRFIETELLAQNQVDAANGRMDAPPSYDRKNL